MECTKRRIIAEFKPRVLFIMLVGYLCHPCLNVFAKPNTSAFNIPSYRYVIGIDAGISATTNDSNTTSFPLGYSTFQYTPSNQTVEPVRFGVSLGRQIPLSHRNTLQLGVSYHYITNMGVDGSLLQGISAPLYPFTYHYSIDSSQLLAEGKLQREYHDVFYPYLMGGIGAGFNRAKNYATSVPDYLTLTPSFPNKSTTSFSYSVGLGIDFMALKSLAVGIGYRFSDLGSVGLGNGQIRTTEITSQLEQSHFYLNTALLEVTYFF